MFCNGIPTHPFCVKFLTAPTVALPRNSRRCPGFAPPHCSIRVGAFPRLRGLLSWKLQKGIRYRTRNSAKTRTNNSLQSSRLLFRNPTVGNQEQMPLVRPYLSMKLLNNCIFRFIHLGTWRYDTHGWRMMNSNIRKFAPGFKDPKCLSCLDSFRLKPSQQFPTTF